MQTKGLLAIALLFGILSTQLQAQNRGSLSGSFETNTAYYFKDDKTGVILPDDRFGTNNYVKLDYSIGKFTGGMQFEGYYPALQGFDTRLTGGKITNKYVTFADRDFKFTLGDFYDQFGSGLIFRSYEDRALGFNNSIEGVNASYGNNFVSVKGIWGRQRKFMGYSESYVRGFDLALQLNEIFSIPVDIFSLEGSWVSKFEKSTSEDIPANVDAFSGRLNFSTAGFSLGAEYVDKGKDPNLGNNNNGAKGNALLIDLGYNIAGLGIQFTGRRLENMDFRSERGASGNVSNINYLPSLTRQHEYSLSNLNPYATQVNGEIGGQIDIFYNAAKKSLIGGKTGLDIHFNASTFYDLKREGIESYEFFAFGEELLFLDMNADIQKRFGKKIKVLLAANYQKFNTVVTGKPTSYIEATTAVVDFTYKFSRKNSLRVEVQHLWTKQDQKNWAQMMLEYSIAPTWSFFISDMYNYGSTKVHYYNGGFSYSKSRTRVALSYGRNRAGYQCSGGVCRLMPAYTGFNLALTSSF